MSDMMVVKSVEGINIFYSTFFGKFIVLFPKGDGSSRMDRFSSAEDAESSILQQKNTNVQNPKKFWWMKDN